MPWSPMVVNPALDWRTVMQKPDSFFVPCVNIPIHFYLPFYDVIIIQYVISTKNTKQSVKTVLFTDM